MTPPHATLVLMRHGESRWNAEDRFAGWVDVPLTPRGRRQARSTGLDLAAAGFTPAVIHTSLLTRATDTADIITTTMRRPAETRASWRLNERHYGNLQGRRRDDVRDEVGVEQLGNWRRGRLDAPPPADPRHPLQQVIEARYRPLGVPVPASESLLDLTGRLLPHVRTALAEDLRHHRSVLVVSHGNVLRALIEQLGAGGATHPEIATGAAVRFDLDEHLHPLSVAAVA